MTTYTGKNILITGGSKGIGRAVGMEFAARGANLFLIARGQAALGTASQEITREHPNARVEIAAIDVTDYAGVAEAVDTMRTTLGSIDGVVCNAGFSIPKYFDDIPPEEFEQTMRVNYLGAVYTAKAALPHMRAGGFITFTSSVAGFLGVFGFTSYSPSKFALIGFAEALNQEVAARGIRVAVLCPPDTDTPGFEEENITKPYETKALSGTAKLMSAQEVAGVFLKQLERGRFIITCNSESAVLYRLQGIAPNFARRYMLRMVRKIQQHKRGVDRV